MEADYYHVYCLLVVIIIKSGMILRGRFALRQRSQNVITEAIWIILHIFTHMFRKR